MKIILLIILIGIIGLTFIEPKSIIREVEEVEFCDTARFNEWVDECIRISLTGEEMESARKYYRNKCYEDAHKFFCVMRKRIVYYKKGKMIKFIWCEEARGRDWQLCIEF